MLRAENVTLIISTSNKFLTLVTFYGAEQKQKLIRVLRIKQSRLTM